MRRRSEGSGRLLGTQLDVAVLALCAASLVGFLLLPDWHASGDEPHVFWFAFVAITAANVRELLRERLAVAPHFALLLIIQFYTLGGPAWTILTGTVPRSRSIDLVFNGPSWDYALAACTVAMLLFWLGYVLTYLLGAGSWTARSVALPPARIGLPLSIAAFAVYAAVVFVGLGIQVLSGGYSELYGAQGDRALASVWLFAEYSLIVGLLLHFASRSYRAWHLNPGAWIAVAYALIALSVGQRQRILAGILALYMVTFLKLPKRATRLAVPAAIVAVLLVFLLVDVGRTLPGGVLPNALNGNSIRELRSGGVTAVADSLSYLASEPTSVTARTVSIYGTAGTDHGLYYLLLPQLLLPRELRPFAMPHEAINTDISFDTISWARFTNYTIGGSAVAEALRSFGSLGLLTFVLWGVLFRFARDISYTPGLRWAHLGGIFLYQAYAILFRNSITYLRGLALVVLAVASLEWFLARKARRAESRAEAPVLDQHGSLGRLP